MSLERPQPFDPSQLTTLEKAFNAAWAVLKPKKMAAGSSQEQAQKLALANCLIAIVKNGITDANELRKQAIELMLIGPAERHDRLL
jgi:hypothetical protein